MTDHADITMSVAEYLALPPGMYETDLEAAMRIARMHEPEFRSNASVRLPYTPPQPEAY